MEEMLQIFPVILCLLGSVLLVVLIILGVKLIYTVNKTNEILDDAYNKTKSLNGFFNAIDSITDTLASINDSIVVNVTNVISKIFPKKKNKKKENEDDE